MTNKMSRRKRIALEKSIEHWDELATRKGNVLITDINVYHCALCSLYFHVGNRIEQSFCQNACPIKNKTSKNFCQNSPWGNARDVLEKWRDSIRFTHNYTSTDRAKKRLAWQRAARKMRNYLQRLL